MVAESPSTSAAPSLMQAARLSSDAAFKFGLSGFLTAKGACYRIGFRHPQFNDLTAQAAAGDQIGAKKPLDVSRSRPQIICVYSEFQAQEFGTRRAIKKSVVEESTMLSTTFQN